MPPKPILPSPGVNLQATPLLLEEGWSQSRLIRFKDGLIQKLGGCVRLISTRFVGICRGMLVWSDLIGNSYVALGTTERLQIITNNTVLSDITPYSVIHDLTAPFTTTAGSPIVTVTDPAASVAINDTIYIQTASFIDGIFLQGIYKITAIVGAGYQFDAGTNALAGVVSGGITTQFTTTNTSHDVVIVLGGFAFVDGQTLTVFKEVNVGGMPIQGDYVVSVTGGATYSITSAYSATLNDSAFENGGNILIAYLIPVSIEGLPVGSGPFGGGPFGSGPFGTGGGVLPIGGLLRQWSMDSWGQDLLAGITSGPIYTWSPPPALGNVATLLPNAPLQSTGFFVNTPNQQVMAYGCTDPNTGLQDPMLVRWSDVGDNTVWNATATNQAGSFRLSAGNQIVGGLAVGGAALLFTDLDMWVVQYIGFPLVYGFQRAARECGLYSKRSVTVAGDVVIWRGLNNYHTYNGTSVVPLLCTVWDFIFGNIDNTVPGASFMGVDAFFTEVFDFFPTAGTNGVCTSYVKYNYKDKNWDYGPIGSMNRSAWAPESSAGNPLGTDYTGLVQVQEATIDMDGVAMDAFGQTGWMALAEGEEHVCLKWFLPDFKMSGGSVLVTLLFSDYADDTDPANPVRVYGPYTVTSTTPYFWVNGRGRYFAMKVQSTALGVGWRLGRCKAILQPDGKGV